MRIKINPKGNGACPLCNKNGKCKITRALTDSIKGMTKPDHLEIVIYICPDFEEIA